METMNLALISRAIYPLHGYGGMERHCYGWIRSMLKQGFRIHVITMPPVDPRALCEFPPEVAFYLVPGVQARSVLRRITSYPAWVQRAARLLSSLESDERIDIVYAHGLAASACIRLRTPFVYNPHGMEEFKCHGLKWIAYSGFRSQNRMAAGKAAAVIATDASLVPEIRKFLRIGEGKISLIPNAINCELRLPSPDREGDEVRFLAVGRLEPNKGFDILIRAFSLARLPEMWSLTIVGDGTLRKRLERHTLKLGLDKKIKFTGNVTDSVLRDHYSRAHLFLNPTLYEGSSLVTLEAMLQEIPVIASRTGGLPDKVLPDRTGWLVDPGNSAELARIIQVALSLRDRWPEMGRNAKDLVVREYSWNRATQLFLDTLRKPCLISKDSEN